MSPTAVSEATTRASDAAKAFDAIAGGEDKSVANQETTKTRKNFLYVFVKFDDGTSDMSPGFVGQTAANNWLSEREKSVTEVRCFFGHERKARRQTKLAFF